jgi:hypothetical protein
MVVVDAMELWSRAGDIEVCETEPICEESILMASYGVSYS